MSQEISVTASVVTYNDIARAPETCESIRKNTKKYPLKLYVIDNASCDGTDKKLDDMGFEVIKNAKNEGFGAAHNKVLSKTMGKYHFVINPDITISSDVIADMVDYFEMNPQAVMAMPRILNTDGTEQKLPKERPTFKRLFLGRLSDKIRSEYVWADKQLDTPTDINFCSGCFFCIRSEVFKKIGGFDKRYFMYLEDADLCLEAKKYGTVQILPQISVTHAWERESSKSLKYLFIHIISCFKFLFKWSGSFK